MPSGAEIPSVEELKTAFDYLDLRGFARTARLPLVAARQWKPAWEMAAWARFREGLPNIHEVGFPRFYLNLEKREVRALFAAITLGRSDQALSKQSELAGLYRGGPKPRWTAVHRFGRYILRSRPDEHGEDWVYFGDDTLFLMKRSRELVSRLSGELSCLDLCCGGGGVGLALPPFDGELLGVDLNPKAIRLAEVTARAQGLSHYRYRCLDITDGLPGKYDLIFGNPPTLSPLLTGKDVFHATGSDEVLPHLLEKVLGALKPAGYALFTFFSQVTGGNDPQWDRLGELLAGRRGFRCYARREYPLGGGRYLRHSALELGPAGLDDRVFQPLVGQGVQLPGVRLRQLR